MTITDNERKALRKRWRLIADDEGASNSLRSEARTILALLDAAEAAQKARDAALEEAAQVAERLNEQQDDWLYPRRQIAFEIRALKGRTA